MIMDIARVGAAPIEVAQRVVQHEDVLFALPRDDGGGGPASRIVASRWAGFASEPRDELTLIEPGRHVLGIALRPMDLTVFVAQKLVHDGRMQQGMLRLNEPGSPIRGIFRGAYDVLHLHIPNPLIVDYVEAAEGAAKDLTTLLGGPQPVLDPVIERLAQSLTRADEIGGAFGRSYADGLGLAIIAKLFGRRPHGASAAAGSRASGLPKWRLKRAVDFMRAHLGDPIGLADIAASTGLTRMHFAAQFRASTGLRPHEYLLRCRIERAQELLAGSRMPLVEIAFEVGFRTQAHFTTVFSRIVGETPNAWRRQNSVAPAKPVVS